MNVNVLKRMTWIMQLIWSLPIVGISFLIHPFLPMISFILHLTVIIVTARRKELAIGNIIGLVTAFFMFFTAVNYLQTQDTMRSLGPLLLSWPLHIASFVFIQRDFRQSKLKAQIKEKEKREKQMRKEREAAAAAKREQIEREKQRKLTREKEHFEKTAMKMKQYLHMNYLISVDTNALMDEKSIVMIHEFLKRFQTPIYISRVVLNELDGLKNTRQGNRGYKARRAINLIETYQEQRKLKLVHYPPVDFLKENNLAVEKNDEHIIGSYLYKQKTTNEKLVLFSNDRLVRVLAKELGLESDGF